MPRLLAAFLLLFTALPARAEPPKLIVKETALAVAEAADRIEAAASEAGAAVVARIDHARNADTTTQIDLPAMQVILIDRIELGSQIMQRNPLAALDLPLEILIYDDAGVTRIAYVEPREMQARWGLDRLEGTFENFVAALDQITAKGVVER